MTAAREVRTKQEHGAPYTTPTLKRLGSATELTQARSMVGAMDGGSNKSRTG